MAKLRRRYAALEAEYGRNAADRLLYENGNLPACIVYQALGRATPHDRAALVNQGYARLGD